MDKGDSTAAARDRTPGLQALAGGIFRTAAAIAAVISVSRLYSYLMRSGVFDSDPALPLTGTAKLLYTGPAILVVIVKLAAGLLVIGTCGWGLALLVRWTASGLRAGEDT